MARFTISVGVLLMIGMLVLSARAAARDVVVARFSALATGETPVEWKPWVFPSIDQQTVYSLVEDDGRVVLRATSVASASALMRDVAVDPARHPFLAWSWKTDADCFSGHWHFPERDDFPLRLFVLFEEPRSVLSIFKRPFSRFKGKALLYLTVAEGGDGDARISHLSDRIRVVPLGGQGGAEVGWSQVTRNVHDDYVELFGEAPPPVKGIALMTDTDNSATACVSYFGDIVFSEAGR